MAQAWANVVNRVSFSSSSRSLPPAKTLIADKGYDSDECKEALAAKKIEEYDL
jgi:IS5 family transposase